MCYHLCYRKETSHRRQMNGRAEVLKIMYSKCCGKEYILTLHAMYTHITLEDTLLQVCRMDLVFSDRFLAIFVRKIRTRAIPPVWIALIQRLNL